MLRNLAILAFSIAQASSSLSAESNLHTFYCVKQKGNKGWAFVNIDKKLYPVELVEVREWSKSEAQDHPANIGNAEDVWDGFGVCKVRSLR